MHEYSTVRTCVQGNPIPVYESFASSGFRTPFNHHRRRNPRNRHRMSRHRIRRARRISHSITRVGPNDDARKKSLVFSNPTLDRTRLRARRITRFVTTTIRRSAVVCVVNTRHPGPYRSFLYVYACDVAHTLSRNPRTRHMCGARDYRTVKTILRTRLLR